MRRFGLSDPEIVFLRQLPALEQNIDEIAGGLESDFCFYVFESFVGFEMAAGILEIKKEIFKNALVFLKIF